MTVKEPSNEYYKEAYLKLKESRKEYLKKRKERLKAVTVELSPEAAHALHVLAKDRGLSKAKVLTRMLEHEFQKKGMELPPPSVPVSQVVTKEIKEQPKIDLQKTLDAWDED